MIQNGVQKRMLGSKGGGQKEIIQNLGYIFKDQTPLGIIFKRMVDRWVIKLWAGFR
jgi:hypothetical protein